MSKIAQCPECGAEVAFTQPGSILSVCGFCHSVVARRDVDVESLGKIGLIADVPSVLQRHLRGRAFGGFIVAGRLQLDHGAGTWNEWYLGLDDGRWLWLAETQGRYYLTAATALAGGDIPGFEGAHPGHTVRLPLPPMPTSAELRLTEAADAGGTLLLRVSEVHTATIVAAEGELPFAVRPGRPVRYLDLSGARGTFGTLDYALDMGLEGEQASTLGLDAPATWLALSSRAAGIASPVAGVTPALDDEALLLAELARARAHGFGAKLCIHPRQVAAVHRALAPTAEEQAWAERVVSAAASAQGAVQLDGRMMDRPVIERARRILARVQS